MLRANPNYLKMWFAAISLKPVHLALRQWGTLGFVCGLYPGLHCYTENIFTANVTKMALALRGFQRHSARVRLCITSTLVLWPRRGRNGGAIFPCSAVSPVCPLIILTPFCTRCYAVEHENKNTLPQVYQVSRHKLVSGWPPLRNLCSLSCFLISLMVLFWWLDLITVSPFVRFSPVGKSKNDKTINDSILGSFLTLETAVDVTLSILVPFTRLFWSFRPKSSSVDWVVSVGTVDVQT